MDYLSVAEVARKWKISERTVRNYCAQGRIKDALLKGKTWMIPADAKRPERKNKSEKSLRTLLNVLRAEKEKGISGGIYHKVQVELTYNSNHIEGSKLTQEETRLIFETHTIGTTSASYNVDDIVETANHFRCIDLVIDQSAYALSESFIKKLHLVLKNGTSDSRKEWFAVGDYKELPNEVGGMETTSPEQVPFAIGELLRSYNTSTRKTLDDILDFYVNFERIHPFQGGNGCVGRLILFKECLRNNIVPFIIDDDLKLFYYRGLKEWGNEDGYLRDTCLSAQDKFKKYLDYFRIVC